MSAPALAALAAALPLCVVHGRTMVLRVVTNAADTSTTLSFWECPECVRLGWSYVATPDTCATPPAAADLKTAVTLTLPEPPSSNRWWRMVVIKGQARMLLSSEARKYKADIGKRFAGVVHDGPMRVSIDWYRGRRSGDLDKRIGVVLDALQGVLYENDAQIIELMARRFDDRGNARVVVTAEPIGAIQESFLPHISP